MACTFRPSEEATKALEQIKKEVGIATNSKALEYVLHQFPVMQNELEGLYTDLEKAEQELKTIKMAIARKTESDRIYNEICDHLISKELSSTW